MGRKQFVKKPEQPVARAASWVVLACIMAALALGTLGVYARVAHHEFIQFDDPEYMVENPYIRDLTTAPGRSIAWAFDPDGHCSNWHPLTWISHMVDYHFFTLEHPGAHHMVNVALHIISTLLLFFALYKMTGSHWKSGFVAALFAIHPAHIESVAWVAERKDVLSTVFWMLTMLIYAYYARSQGAKKIALYAGMLVVFFLGLLAKPMLVTLPFVLLLLDWWPLGRFAAPVVEKKSVRRQSRADPGLRSPQTLFILLEKVPLLAMSAFGSYMTYRAQHFALASGTLTVWMRLDNAVVACMNYIGKLFWPANLAVNYPHPGDKLPEVAVALSCLGFAALTAVVFACFRRQNYVRMGWLWFLGTLVPVSGMFVQVGEQGMADRYTYVPFIGLFIIIAWGVPAILDRYMKPAPKGDAGGMRPVLLGVSAGVVIAALSVSTFLQLAYWQNSDTLFRHAIEVTPPNITAQINLGAYLEKQGKRDEAIEHYEAALAINDKHVRSLNLLATAYARAAYAATTKEERDRMLSKAIGIYQTALTLSDDPLVHNNIGSALNNVGRPAEAVPHLEMAVKIKSDFVMAYNNLGTSYFLLGKWDQSIDAFNQALAINQNSADAYAGRGFTYVYKGDFTRAAEDYKQALAISPKMGDVHAKLSAAYYYLKEYRGAWSELQTAKGMGLQIDPRLEALIAAKLGGSR